MANDLVVFDEIRRYLRANKPDSIKEEEIGTHCDKFTILNSLMGSIFSTLQQKRVNVESDKICSLKSYQNLIRIK